MVKQSEIGESFDFLIWVVSFLTKKKSLVFRVPGFLGTTFEVKMAHLRLLWIEITPSRLQGTIFQTTMSQTSSKILMVFGWLHPSLWTSRLVAMHDDIGNRSIGRVLTIDDCSRTIDYCFSYCCLEIFVGDKVVMGGGILPQCPPD